MPEGVRRIQPSTQTPLKPELRRPPSAGRARDAREPKKTVARSRLTPKLEAHRPMSRRQVRSAMARIKSEARVSPQRTLQAASGLISRPSDTIREAARSVERSRS